MGIQVLAGIARNSKSDSARVQAAKLLLDRAWGPPVRAHSGEDGGDLQIVVRHISAEVGNRD
jgi:hypothetical protein